MNEDDHEDLDEVPLLVSVTSYRLHSLIFLGTPRLIEVDETSRRASPSRKLDREKIPLTLLTGYLGAGKSTLLELAG